MDKNLLIIGLVGIAVTAVIAVHFANKGVPVSVGTPLFKATFN